MPTHLKSKIIVATLFLNLITSGLIAHAQITTGLITISSCTANCLSLTVPETLTSPTLYFNNTKKSIYPYGNYNLEQGVYVNNLQDTGGFELLIQTSNFMMIENDNIIALPYYDHDNDIGNIGVLTFNNSSTSSVDGTSTYHTSLPVAPTDPVEKGVTQEPFSQDELIALINSEANFENHFEFFSGNGLVSNPIKIMETLPGAPSMGNYQLGIGLIIIFPDNALSSYNIKDGQYSGTATFTLTST